MSGTLGMMGVGSPISLRSADSRASKDAPKMSSRGHDRPSYRLFPSVEPTPPASPAVQRKPVSRLAESRKRSSSLDDVAIAANERQNVPARQAPAQRGRKLSIPEVEPMSTVQESLAESPTVPTMYPAPPFASEDTIHGRPSSAPGERSPQRIEGHMRRPSGSKLRSAWTSRRAEQHPQAVQGLGLTLPPNSLTPRQPRKQGPGKPKPNLRINVDHEDRPPPPPPKSPRHSRNPSIASIHSGVSSMHGESPDSDAVVTPGSIVREALLDMKHEALPTPFPQQAQAAHYRQTSGQVRVREVAISKDHRRKLTDTSSLQTSDSSSDKAISTKPRPPDIDKPMPSLPTPVKRFSAHLREVQEAERGSLIDTQQDSTTPKDAQSSAPADTPMQGNPSFTPLNQKSNNLDTALQGNPSSETLSQKSNDLDIQQFPQPAKSPGKPPARDFRSPTPDRGLRPPSPANLLQTTSSTTKVLPILPNEGPPYSRSGTPDSIAATLKPAELKSLRADPLQTLQDLNRQSEALHSRYASLRADRVKISTAITASLKDEKRGTDYANILLDKHLALNAINSSMDICFAKLKSLDCRKEEAMNALMRQAKMKIMMEDSWKSESVLSLAPPVSIQSGRSTPEIGPDLIPTSKFSSTAPPVLEPSQDKSESPKPEFSPSKDVPESSPQKESPEPEKRVTIIRATSTKSSAPSSSSDQPPQSPISSMYGTKRIRIKGIKAAKILGLVAQSVTGTETGGNGITLPDETARKSSKKKKPIAVEVEIKREPAQGKGTPTTDTAPSTPPVPTMPQRKPPPAPKHDTKDSVSSSVASSQTESSPEEPEVATPTTVGSAHVPYGLQSGKSGMLSSIQVLVDDDILEYYKEGA